MKCTECNKEIKPVIGVDIDGTLAQYHETVTMFSSRYFDRPHPDELYDGNGPFREYLGLTQAEHRAMKLAFRQGGNKRMMPPYPYVDDFFNDIRYLGAEVWVATTRPWQRLDNVDPDTQEWLRRCGIEIDGLLYGDDKYEQLILAVGIERIVGVFDDLPDQIDHARVLGLPAYQIWRPHNSFSSTRRVPGGNLSEAPRWVARRIDEWTSRYES